MKGQALEVQRVGHATLQDLGRPGLAHLGIAANGAADQHAARTANVLVGNADDAPVLEVTASALRLVARRPLLIAVTGAAGEVLLDGTRQPAREPLAVFPGTVVSIPAGGGGLRSYFAVNGALAAPRAFASVAPDALLGVGWRLAAGDVLELDTRYAGTTGPYAGLFRLGAPTPRATLPAYIDVTPGPDATGEVAWQSASYAVSPMSDHIGLRLLGPVAEADTAGEILSRGVPVGAVEVPPTGGLIVLLRARMLTAGYPVVAVVTSVSLDRLGQLRPGDVLFFSSSTVAAAHARLARREHELQRLARRVRTAFVAAGLGAILAAGHAAPAHGELQRR